MTLPYDVILFNTDFEKTEAGKKMMESGWQSKSQHELIYAHYIYEKYVMGEKSKHRLMFKYMEHTPDLKSFLDWDLKDPKLFAELEVISMSEFILRTQQGLKKYYDDLMDHITENQKLWNNLKLTWKQFVSIF